MAKQTSIDEPVILETNTGKIAYITAKVNNKVVGIPILDAKNNEISLIQPTMGLRLRDSTLYSEEDVSPFTNADNQHLGIAVVLKDHVYALPLFQVPENTLDTITLHFNETTFVTGLSSCKSKRKKPLSMIFSINDKNYGMPLFRFTHLYNVQNGKTVEWSKVAPKWYCTEDGNGERTYLSPDQKKEKFYPKDPDVQTLAYPPGLPNGTNEPSPPPPPSPPAPPPVSPIAPPDLLIFPPYEIECAWRSYMFDGNATRRPDPFMPPSVNQIDVHRIYDLHPTTTKTSLDETANLIRSCVEVIRNTIPEFEGVTLEKGEDMISALNQIRELMSGDEKNPGYFEYEMDYLPDTASQLDCYYELNILIENLKWLNTHEFWEYRRHDDGKFTPLPYRPSLDRSYKLPSGIFVYPKPTHDQELRWFIKTMLSIGKPTVDFGSDFGSTYLNNKITAYSDLINRIKMQFGWPNVEPDVCDENIAENIDQAIELYSKYAGYTEEYLVFHTRLYKPGAGLRLDKLFSMSSDMFTQSYEGDEHDIDYDIQNYRKVLNCFSIEPGESTGINTLFTIESALAQQTQFAYLLGEGRGFDLTSYTAVKSYLDTREKVLTQRLYYRFDPYTQYLRLTPEPRIYDSFLGCLGCYVEKPIRELIIERWVFEYALALTMIECGFLRTKYTIQMLGGSTLRGDEVLNRGTEKKKELEEQLFRGTGWVESQPTFLIG